jgi:hypothetical protein
MEAAEGEEEEQKARTFCDCALAALLQAAARLSQLRRRRCRRR